jgi:acyl dehydratase
MTAVEFVKSLARIVYRELREGKTPRSLRGERLFVERWGLRVAPRRLAAYLRVTGAMGIPRFHGADALLSPLYPAVWEAGLALELLSHPSAPSLRGGVLHLETELFQIRPLHTTDSIRCRLELERAESEPRGVRLHLLHRTWNGIGQLGSESRTVLLVRDRSPTSARGDREDEIEEPRDWVEIAQWRLRSNYGRRYARASGDYNPIHLSRLTALPFGFRRPILHGFCIQALVAHGLIEHRFGREPARLRRLQISFRAPLLLPADMHLQMAEAKDGVGVFRVMSKQSARHAEGEFAGG